MVKDRRLATAGDRINMERVNFPPAELIWAIAFNHSPDHKPFVGVVSGCDYGHFRNGDVLKISIEDFEQDKRILRMTQETMRLFT